MNERVSIVITSTHTNEEKKDLIEQIESTCEYPIDIMFINNQGGAPLAKVYHDYLYQVPNNIVIFIHDDIEFLKSGWCREIVRLFNKHEDYGIIGVAGSSYFDKNAAWWRYKKIYGQVLHRHEGKSWLTAFSPLLDKDLQQVCVIDGLFMAVNRKRISKNFDENLKGFDFYDIKFCLDNHLDGKTKIGVTTNIRLAHNSIGQMRPTWYENRDYINNAFKDLYPIEIKE